MIAVIEATVIAAIIAFFVWLIIIRPRLDAVRSLTVVIKEVAHKGIRAYCRTEPAQRCRLPIFGRAVARGAPRKSVAYTGVP